VFVETSETTKRTIGIYHEDTTGRSSVFVGDCDRVNLPVLGHICGIVDDTPNQQTSSQIIFRIRSDLELTILRELRSTTGCAELTLKWLNPCSREDRVNLLTFSSVYPNHPTEVVYAGYPFSLTSASLAFLVGSFFLSRAKASSLVIASVMYRNETALTNLKKYCKLLVLEKEDAHSLFWSKVDNKLP
jgi:hypothetical protein